MGPLDGTQLVRGVALQLWGVRHRGVPHPDPAPPGSPSQPPPLALPAAAHAAAHLARASMLLVMDGVLRPTDRATTTDATGKGESCRTRSPGPTELARPRGVRFMPQGLSESCSGKTSLVGCGSSMHCNASRSRESSHLRMNLSVALRCLYKASTQSAISRRSTSLFIASSAMTCRGVLGVSGRDDREVTDVRGVDGGTDEARATVRLLGGVEGTAVPAANAAFVAEARVAVTETGSRGEAKAACRLQIAARAVMLQLG